MSRFRKLSHAIWHCQYHLVWVPKYRCLRPCTGFLTGQHPARVGIFDYLRPDADNGLSRDHNTLAEMLRGAGYATGMIGKWHLTGYAFHGAGHEVRAKDHGFDEELVSEAKRVGNGANVYPYVFCDQKNSKPIQKPNLAY